MTVAADVLVVGGGLAGVSAALAAARAGASVALAEKSQVSQPVLPAGVRVLERSPVLELLTDAEGTVVGARGLVGSRGYEPYEVRAGAVVLATGSCDYGAKTGDGALFAVEAGAELSGMEFSEVVAVSPDPSALAFTPWARFYRADGSLIEAASGLRARAVVTRILQTEPVYARLDLAQPPVRNQLRLSQARFFLPFDLQGIDPFTELFPVTLSLEARVFSEGGIRVRRTDGWTGVPGLFAAGGAAAQDRADASLTAASGKKAGRAAAKLGAAAAGRMAYPTGGAGLRPSGTTAGSHEEVRAAVRAEILPYDRNHLRHANWLNPALAELDAVWMRVRSSLGGIGEDAVCAREAAAMTAYARWTYAAALARTESRGVHRRSDYPSLDPAQQHRLNTGGLDAVWTKAEAGPARFCLDPPRASARKAQRLYS
jgi:succinate dehydrogenase/fumarate reductase flavoprotein subunit